MNAAPQISVIVPSYNKAHVLPETLEALNRQSVDVEKFEVIVVDDRYNDDTVKS